LITGMVFGPVQPKPRPAGQLSVAERVEPSAAAMAFGRITLSRADGSSDTCNAILIGPGQALTPLQAIDQAVEARMVMVCCGELDVDSVLAADELLNLAVVSVTGVGEPPRPVPLADVPPAPGDKVFITGLTLEKTGLLLVAAKILDVCDWGTISPALIINRNLEDVSGWGPVFNSDGALCGFIVGSAGRERSVAARFPWPSLAAGPGLPLKDWAARERSPLVRARELAYRAEHGETGSGSIKTLREAVTLDPANGNAWWRFGVLLDEAGRGDESIAALQRAAELLPRYSEPPFSLGLVHLKKDDSAGSIPFFERAAAVEPAHPDARAMLAVALLQTGRAEEAIPPAREACRLAPERFQFYQNLAIILKAAGHEQEIPDAWKPYCDRKPEDAAGWAQLGSALLSADRLKEAEAPLRKAEAIDPGQSATVTRLAVCLAKLGRVDEAAATLEGFLEQHPEDQVARRILTAIRRAGPP